MNKFIAYLRTKSFRDNLLIAGLVLIVSLLILFYSLRVYTRHGEGLLVPKLGGMSVENAIQILESQGLQYQIDTVYVADKAPGLVIEQDPDPNTNITKFQWDDLGQTKAFKISILYQIKVMTK